MRRPATLCFFFFNDTATTEIYTLSLHDALPIFGRGLVYGNAYEMALKLMETCYVVAERFSSADFLHGPVAMVERDRKSTRLNSSHLVISYAVFCLKKKKTTTQTSLATHITTLPT